MARPTKKEIAAKKKAEAAARKAEENAKLQEELARKSEERTKKKAAEIAERNSKIKPQEITNEESKVVQKKSEVTNESELEMEEKDNYSSQKNIEEVNQVQSGNNNDIPDITHQMDIPEEIAQELQNQTAPQDYQLPDDDFDPLKEKVIKRSYTDGKLGNTSEPVNVENISSEQNTTSENTGEINQGQQTTNQQTVVEPVIEEPVIKPQDPKIYIDDDGGASNLGEQTQTKTERPKTEPVNPKLEDLSPSQKRKAAEKTADALITTYANLVPIPFKAMSSFNMRKLDARHLNDEIDKNMVIMDDGTRVVDYCEQVNSQAEETFVVTKEMQDEIREPLIDVLLENNFALTPTQRLIMVVGGQIVQMGITAIQFMQQNKNAMETFKKFHEENKSIKSEVKSAINENQKNNSSSTPENNSSNNNIKDVRDFSKDSNLDIPTTEEEASQSSISVEEYLESE